jgi:hypothetical protein
MGKIFGISDLPVSLPFVVTDSRTLIPRPIQTVVTRPMPNDKVSFAHSQKVIESKVSTILRSFTSKAKK